MISFLFNALCVIVLFTALLIIVLGGVWILLVELKECYGIDIKDRIANKRRKDRTEV